MAVAKQQKVYSNGKHVGTYNYDASGNMTGRQWVVDGKWGDYGAVDAATVAEVAKNHHYGQKKTVAQMSRDNPMPSSGGGGGNSGGGGGGSTGGGGGGNTDSSTSTRQQDLFGNGNTYQWTEDSGDAAPGSGKHYNKKTGRYTRTTSKGTVVDMGMGLDGLIAKYDDYKEDDWGTKLRRAADAHAAKSDEEIIAERKAAGYVESDYMKNIREGLKGKYIKKTDSVTGEDVSVYYDVDGTRYDNQYGELDTDPRKHENFREGVARNNFMPDAWNAESAQYSPAAAAVRKTAWTNWDPVAKKVKPIKQNSVSSSSSSSSSGGVQSNVPVIPGVNINPINPSPGESNTSPPIINAPILSDSLNTEITQTAHIDNSMVNNISNNTIGAGASVGNNNSINMINQSAQGAQFENESTLNFDGGTNNYSTAKAKAQGFLRGSAMDFSDGELNFKGAFR